ncbi:MAG: hypothetical protein M3Q34_01130 [bacterium]|nr:hypothetical protein [bacterium]
MIKKIFSFILVFTVITSVVSGPIIVSAQAGLVPCGTEKKPVVAGQNGTETGGEVINPCGFKHVFKLINGLIDFIFKFMVVPIAAIMFAYAGFLMLFSGGNAGKSEKAKGIFINVAFGLVIAAAAWLIIHTLLDIVGVKSWVNTFGL